MPMVQETNFSSALNLFVRKAVGFLVLQPCFLEQPQSCVTVALYLYRLDLLAENPGCTPNPTCYLTSHFHLWMTDRLSPSLHSHPGTVDVRTVSAVTECHGLLGSCSLEVFHCIFFHEI